jgi:thiamine-monophosphate kinase
LCVRESTLLEHIALTSADLSAAFPGVIAGPGDDCAVVRTPAHAGGLLLLKVDQLVEGRHCELGAAPGLMGRKALARPLSDIAAAAGRPMYALAAAAVPVDMDQARVRAVFDAVHEWGRRWACPVVGGDIAGLAPGREGAGGGTGMVLSISVVGAAHEKRGAVTRRGARVGDEVWVTGRIGGALTSGRHAVFEPRLREAAGLADVLGAELHAMMDVSDGLGIDADRLAKRSGVAIEIERALVPLHADADPATALADGEDYELLFAAAPGAAAVWGVKGVGGVCPGTPTGLTRIGRVVSGDGLQPGCVIVERDGSRVSGAGMGWDHGAGDGGER